MAPQTLKKKGSASTKASAVAKSPAAKKTAPSKKAAAAVSKKSAPSKEATAAAAAAASKKSSPSKKATAASASKKATAAASAGASKKVKPSKRAATTASKKPTPSKKAAAPSKKTTTAKKNGSTAAEKSAKAKKPAPAKKSALASKKPAPSAKAARASKAPTKRARNSKPVIGKRGLKGQAAPVAANGRVGTVDPAAKLSSDAVLAEEERDLELDAMLTLIDVSKNTDKYFILQVICEPPQSAAKRSKGSKTGKHPTDDAAEKLEGPFDELGEALALFNAKFKEKTGNDWDAYDQEDRYLVNSGKYTCLRPNAAQISATPWQYWVNDGVDGKVDGWYDYDYSAAAVVEQLHAEFQTNPGLSQRVVAGGAWIYLFDFSRRTQTMASLPGRKARHICRNPGRSLPNTPPGPSVSKAGKAKAKATTASTGAAAAPGPTLGSQGSAEIDKFCHLAGSKGVSVCVGRDVKLNQTNISANNNKFYIIQMLYDAAQKKWLVWTRWGRVGEVGSSAMLGPFQGEDVASTAFKKKFREKTSNKWEDAQNGLYKAVPGKYELIETDNTDPTASSTTTSSGGTSSSSSQAETILPCKLDPATKELVELIFSEDMFKSACTAMNVDIKKMPLGQLSKAQVQRGYNVLEELEDVLKQSGWNRENMLEQLSARFYQAYASLKPWTLDDTFSLPTICGNAGYNPEIHDWAARETTVGMKVEVIPHAFGRNRPPVINTADMLRIKGGAIKPSTLDIRHLRQPSIHSIDTIENISNHVHLQLIKYTVEMLNVLQDIGEAQSMLSSTDGAGKGAKVEDAPRAVPHPTDVNYGHLKAQLKLLSPQSHEHGVIKRYLENTKPEYGDMEMYDVWTMDREGEAQRFAAHDKISNRKLLWHGTNVAVVAAIVKSGLRIMPHSGGRVGRGIYLASENAKSRQYVRPAYRARSSNNVGVMFLCEAALGREHNIMIDDWQLTSPPQGFDSIVARGVQEPDPSKDTTLAIDGKQVTVPQGKPKPVATYQKSRFNNSEYLLYQESQQRIRYMLTVKV